MPKIDVNGGVVFDKKEVEDIVLASLPLIEDIDGNESVAELIRAIKNVKCDQILAHVREIEQGFPGHFSNVVLCGIGGSSLGVRAFILPKALDGTLHRKCFFLENIDPVSVLSVLRDIKPLESLFVFVSKSGNTIETLVQTECVLRLLESLNVAPQGRCISITSDHIDSDLLRISLINYIKVYPWSGDVGGRFSAITTSTLLPIALCGCDITSIAEAGRELNISDSLPGGVINYLLWHKGHDVTVMMPYSDQLVSFAAWYKQLWAESVGKEGFGSMPEISVGTTDQHSMLQMYLGGKKNKFFNLIKIDSNNSIFSDQPSQQFCADLRFTDLLGKKGSVKLADMLKVACKTTADILIKEGMPVRVITIPVVNEYYIAKMMVDFFFETIFTVSLANKYLGYNISPFGQPDVEKSKSRFIGSIVVQ